MASRKNKPSSNQPSGPETYQGYFIAYLIMAIISFFIGFKAGSPIFIFAAILFLIISLLFKKMHQNSKNSTQINNTAVSKPAWEYQTFKVAGVTFDTDGTPRQQLLFDLKYKVSVFQSLESFKIIKYDFEGEDAYSVNFNDIQIGNIPRADIPRYKEIEHKKKELTTLHVTGGDNELYYGCKIGFKVYEESSSDEKISIEIS